MTLQLIQRLGSFFRNTSPESIIFMCATCEEICEIGHYLETYFPEGRALDVRCEMPFGNY